MPGQSAAVRSTLCTCCVGQVQTAAVTFGQYLLTTITHQLPAWARQYTFIAGGLGRHPQRNRLRLPHSVMAVSWPNQGMGNFMQKCFGNHLLPLTTQMPRQGDHLTAIVATAQTVACVVKTKPPAAQTMLAQQLLCERLNLGSVQSVIRGIIAGSPGRYNSWARRQPAKVERMCGGSPCTSVKPPLTLRVSM